MSTLPNGCLDPVADDSRQDRLDFHPDLPDPIARESEDEMGSSPSKKPDHSFWSAPLGLRELIARQGVKPLQRIEDLRAGVWPEDESVEDFIATIRRWRSEGG